MYKSNIEDKMNNILYVLSTSNGLKIVSAKEVDEALHSNVIRETLENKKLSESDRVSAIDKQLETYVRVVLKAERVEMTDKIAREAEKLLSDKLNKSTNAYKKFTIDLGFWSYSLNIRVKDFLLLKKTAKHLLITFIYIKYLSISGTLDIGLIRGLAKFMICLGYWYTFKLLLHAIELKREIDKNE